MQEYTKDTAKEYDDLVGYVASDNIPIDLGEFIGDETEYKPTVAPKKINPDFPEEWQMLYVNFSDFDMYAQFMFMLNMVPLPKLKEFVFTQEEQINLEAFFND